MLEAMERNVRTWDSDANGEATSGRTTRARVRKRSPGAEQPVVAVKSPKRDGAKGLCYGAKFNEPTRWEVWEAYKRVKANHGAAGVDEQTIADFERNLKGNLYKIWNRMSSGSYFPPPVRTVKIPKANGGKRKLGIPTVSDRIAQQVVKSRLEPAVDPLFHPDSYGYRPGKSALDAVGQARQRCWRYDWILDLDIKGFFDNIPQDLLIRAVKKHAKEQWIVLYVEYGKEIAANSDPRASRYDCTICK